jgi:hypothetical protein
MPQLAAHPKGMRARLALLCTTEPTVGEMIAAGMYTSGPDAYLDVIRPVAAGIMTLIPPPDDDP